MAEFRRGLRPVAFELIAARFRVLSDPLRLRILHELQGGERNVGELVEALAAGQPSVSKHLKVLYEAGLLSRRQEGTAVFYEILDPEIFKLCELVCSSIESRVRNQADATLKLLGTQLARAGS
jgi:DNA-binding transcriptional ArsR family regulator